MKKAIILFVLFILSCYQANPAVEQVDPPENCQNIEKSGEVSFEIPNFGVNYKISASEDRKIEVDLPDKAYISHLTLTSESNMGFIDDIDLFVGGNTQIASYKGVSGNKIKMNTDGSVNIVPFVEDGELKVGFESTLVSPDGDVTVNADFKLVGCNDEQTSEVG